MINKFVKVKYLFTLNMGQSPDSESCNTLGMVFLFFREKLILDIFHLLRKHTVYHLKKLRIQVIFSYPFGLLLVI